MYKSLWKKVLVLGIILLFFGSSVLSSMSSSVMKIKNRKAILDSEDWTLTEIVSLESDGNSFHPSLDIDSNGTLHIAWKDSEGYYDNIVYKYKPNGGSWSDPEIVYSHYEICSSSPSLMVD